MAADDTTRTITGEARIETIMSSGSAALTTILTAWVVTITTTTEEEECRRGITIPIVACTVNLAGTSTIGRSCREMNSVDPCPWCIATATTSQDAIIEIGTTIIEE